MSYTNAATDDLFFDIETVPTQQDRIYATLDDAVREKTEAALAEVKAPGNYKDEAKIAEYIEAKRSEIILASKEQLDELHHKTALDGAFGELFCIAFSINDEEPLVLHRNGELTIEAEREVLIGFFREVGLRSTSFRKRLIGHNVVGFDIRFLWQRAMVLGVQPPAWLPMDPKPWDDTVFDTMVRWAGVRGTVKLSKLCTAFGIEDTDEIDGSEVWNCVQRGDGQKVIDHCFIDVDKVRSVFRRMTFKA